MAALKNNKIILSKEKLHFILERLTHQLVENHIDFENSILIGIQPRGIKLCDRIHQILEKKLGKSIQKGFIDISLHRDDIHLMDKPQSMSQTIIPSSLDNKNIILIDDVLYSGRTIRAALDTLMDYGRPRDIELLVLIDRRLHRHVPIQAKYIGQSIDSIEKERVQVYIDIENQDDRVEIYTHKEPTKVKG
jgi:pyrimidine operon attenuation protein / uracil phosphoribosyltransferase